MHDTKPLWPNGVVIPVIGVTGALGTGKTLFAATIAPLRTIYIDIEKSALTYRQLGFEHVDLIQDLTNENPRGYTSFQLFNAWYEIIKSIDPGQYDVVVTDPISDIESGMVDFVKGRATRYGYKSPESFAKSKGIFWNIVRDEYKRIIAMITAKCQTFVYTTHMKTVWKNGEPTKDRMAKGKTTLREMTTLSLEMHRDVKCAGGVPSAVVDRDRIASFTTGEDGVVTPHTVMPGRMPVATPEALRKYILQPTDLSNPSDGEVAPEQIMSKEELLLIEARIADNNREAAELQLAAVEAASKKGMLNKDVATRIEPVVKAVDDGAKDVTQSTQRSDTAGDAKLETAGTDAPEPTVDYYEEICQLLIDADSVGKKRALRTAIEGAISSVGGDPEVLEDLPIEKFQAFRTYTNTLLKEEN